MFFQDRSRGKETRWRGGAETWSLDRWDLGVNHHLVPLVDLFPEIGLKFHLRTRDDIEAEIGAFLFHIGKLHQLDDLAMEQIDNLFGRSSRNEHTLEGFGFLIGDAGLRHGRYIRRGG